MLRPNDTFKELRLIKFADSNESPAVLSDTEAESDAKQTEVVQSLTEKAERLKNIGESNYFKTLYNFEQNGNNGQSVKSFDLSQTSEILKIVEFSKGQPYETDESRKINELLDSDELYRDLLFKFPDGDNPFDHNFRDFVKDWTPEQNADRNILYNTISKLKKAFKEVMVVDKTKDDLMDVFNGKDNTGKKMLRRIKRVTGQIPDEFTVAAGTLCVAVAFGSEKMRNFAIAAGGAIFGLFYLKNLELPRADTTFSENFRDVYFSAAPGTNDTHRKKAVSMLESLSTTLTAPASFGLIWEDYQKAKDNKDIKEFKKEIEDNYRNNNEELSDEFAAKIAMNHSFIKGEQKTNATLALATFDNKFQDLLLTLQKDNSQQWEHLKDLPFGYVVNELTRLMKERRLGDSTHLTDDFLQMVSSGTKKGLAKGAEIYDQTTEKYLGNGGELEDAAKNQLKVPDADYDARNKSIRMYGVYYEVKNWVLEDGTPAKREKESKAVGAKINNGTEDIIIWLEDSGRQTSFDAKTESEKIVEAEIKEQASNLGVTFDVKQQWNPDIKTSIFQSVPGISANGAWTSALTLPDLLSVKQSRREIVLQIRPYLKDTTDKYSMSFYFKDDKEQKEVTNPEEYVQKTYEEQLKKDLSRTFSINEKYISILPGQINKLLKKDPSIPQNQIEVNLGIYGKNLNAVATYENEKWTYEIKDPSMYEDYLSSIYDNLKDEIYGIDSNFLGIPVPKSATKYFDNHASSVYKTDNATLSSLIDASAREAHVELSSAKDKAEFIRKEQEKITNIRKTIEDHHKTGHPIPDTVFDSFRDISLIDPRYKEEVRHFTDKLDVMNFKPSIEAELIMKYQKELKQQIGTVQPPNENTRRYANYVAQKYIDLQLLQGYEIYRNFEDYRRTERKLNIVDGLENPYIASYRQFTDPEFAYRYIVTPTEKGILWGVNVGDPIEYAYSPQMLAELIQAENDFYDQHIATLSTKPAKAISMAALMRIRYEYLGTVLAGKTTASSVDYLKFLNETIYKGQFGALFNEETAKKIADGTLDLGEWFKQQGITGTLAWTGNKLGEVVGGTVGAALHGLFTAGKETIFTGIGGENPVTPIDRKASGIEKRTGAGPAPVTPTGEIKQGTNVENVPGTSSERTETPTFKAIEDDSSIVFSGINLEKGNQPASDKEAYARYSNFYAGDILSDGKTSYVYLGKTPSDYILQDLDSPSRIIYLSITTKLLKNQNSYQISMKKNLARPGNMITLTNLDNPTKTLNATITKIEGQTVYFEYERDGNVIRDQIDTSNPSTASRIIRFYPNGTTEALERTKSQIPRTSAHNYILVYDQQYDVTKDASGLYSFDFKKEKEYDYLTIGYPINGEIKTVGFIRISKAKPELTETSINGTDWTAKKSAEIQAWLDKDLEKANYNNNKEALLKITSTDKKRTITLDKEKDDIGVGIFKVKDDKEKEIAEIQLDYFERKEGRLAISNWNEFAGKETSMSNLQATLDAIPDISYTELKKAITERPDSRSNSIKPLESTFGILRVSDVDEKKGEANYDYLNLVIEGDTSAVAARIRIAKKAPFAIQVMEGDGSDWNKGKPKTLTFKKLGIWINKLESTEFSQMREIKANMQ